MPDLAVGGVAAAAATWLLTYLLHSTVVVGAVWLLAWTGRVRRPTTLDLLWKVALVAAVATTSVEVLTPPARVARTVRVEADRPAPGREAAWMTPPPVTSRAVAMRVRAVDPTPACREVLARLRSEPWSEAPALRRACVTAGGPGWRGSLVAVWLLGAGLLLFRAFWLRRDVAASLRGAVPAGAGPAAVVRGLLGSSRRPVSVVVAPTLETPCVVAGRIVLPARCVRELTDDQIRAVLAHEVAHLVRRDPAWMGFGELLCRALWVQPLNRVALAGLRESAELACDDWAVERTRRPVELASSIARVAEWVHPGHRSPVLAPLAQLAYVTHGEGRALSGRVRRLLTAGAPRRPSSRPLRIALAALVVAPTLAVPAVPRASEVYAVFIRRAEVGEAGSAQSLEVMTEDVVVLSVDGPPATR